MVEPNSLHKEKVRSAKERSDKALGKVASVGLATYFLAVAADIVISLFPKKD